MVGIMSQEGFKQLWRGNTAQMYKCFYQALVRVTFYDMIKHGLMPNDKYEVSCSVRVRD